MKRFWFLLLMCVAAAALCFPGAVPAKPPMFAPDLSNPGPIGDETPGTGAFTTLVNSKHSVSTKTDDYVVLSTDLGKTLIMNSADDKTFTLPSVDADDIGAILRLGKIGTGKLTLDAADSDTIGDSGAGDTIYCGGAGKAFIEIELISATAWIIKTVVNEPAECWVTTD